MQTLPASAMPSTPRPEADVFVPAPAGEQQSGHGILRNGWSGPEPRGVPGQRPVSGHGGSRGTAQRLPVFADPRSDQHHGVPSSRCLVLCELRVPALSRALEGLAVM